MNIRTRISALWKDPVGSNIIAGIILALAGYCYIRLASSSSASRFLAHPVSKIVLPGLALAVALPIFLRFRRSHKTLVFVSTGGTCRDPMAKIITMRLLEKRPGLRIKVRAAGMGPLSGAGASYAARYVIREMYGEDLLKEHRPELLTPELVEEADLILVMDKSLFQKPGKILPRNKTFLLKEFFGLSGDVVDPWQGPDEKDSATLQRYRQCAEELRRLLTDHIDKIVDVLAI